MKFKELEKLSVKKLSEIRYNISEVISKKKFPNKYKLYKKCNDILLENNFKNRDGDIIEDYNLVLDKRYFSKKLEKGGYEIFIFNCPHICGSIRALNPEFSSSTFGNISLPCIISKDLTESEYDSVLESFNKLIDTINKS